MKKLALLVLILVAAFAVLPQRTREQVMEWARQEYGRLEKTVATLQATPAAGSRASSPSSAPSAPVVGGADEEQAILAMINDERSKLGVGPLVIDEGLRAAALARSQDMLARQYISHNDPETGASLNPADAEVIAWYCGWRNLNAAHTVRVWWNSPEHYKIITNGEFHRIGMGIVYGKYRGSSCVLITGVLGR